MHAKAAARKGRADCIEDYSLLNSLTSGVYRGKAGEEEEKSPRRPGREEGAVLFHGLCLVERRLLRRLLLLLLTSST